MHPNEELLRREYDAFARGDFQALDEIFDDDVVYHLPGRNPLAGEHRGKEAVFALFRRDSGDTGGTFRAELHDVLASDGHAVALNIVSGERGGKVLHGQTVHVVHVRDGRIVEAWLFPSDQYANDEFWS